MASRRSPLSEVLRALIQTDDFGVVSIDERFVRVVDSPASGDWSVLYEAAPGETLFSGCVSGASLLVGSSRCIHCISLADGSCARSIDLGGRTLALAAAPESSPILVACVGGDGGTGLALVNWETGEHGVLEYPKELQPEVLCFIQSRTDQSCAKDLFVWLRVGGSGGWVG